MNPKLLSREPFNRLPIRQALSLIGNYFACTNDQTGLATAAAPVSFSATNPFLVIYNSPNVADEKDIILDSVALSATATGSAGASVRAAVTIDDIKRYTSGGTDLTTKIVNTNMKSAKTSVAKIYAGNLLAPAAHAARVLVGQEILKGAIPVVGDRYVMAFGKDGSDTAYVATLTRSLVNLPPVVIGPGHSALIHLWLPSQSGASSYIPEVNWHEE